MKDDDNASACDGGETNVQTCTPPMLTNEVKTEETEESASAFSIQSDNVQSINKMDDDDNAGDSGETNVQTCAPPMLQNKVKTEETEESGSAISIQSCETNIQTCATPLLHNKVKKEETEESASATSIECDSVLSPDAQAELNPREAGFSSENFKIEINNLPKHMGFKVIIWP